MYTNVNTDAATTCVDIELDASPKLVDKFCYLDDMLTINLYRDAEANCKG